MDLEELVQAIQSSYQTQFAAFVQSQHETCRTCSAEVKFEIKDIPSLLGSIYVVDFIRNDESTQAVEMYPDRMIYFSEQRFRVDNSLAVTMTSAVWGNIRFTCDPAPPDNNLREAFMPFFDYWLDPNDKRAVYGQEIGGIVHSISIDSGTVEIDFGSAPTDAFFDALNRLADAGCAAVQVTSGISPQQ